MSKVTAVVVLLLAVTVVQAAPASAADTADDRANAAAVALGDRLVVDKTEATLEEGETPGSCAADAASVWFALTLPQRTAVEIDTIASTYDTTLTVIGPDEAEVACHDDENAAEGVRSSRLQFMQPAGTYLLRVGGKPAGGELHLHVLAAGPLITDAGVSISDIEFGITDGRAILSGWANCSRPAYFIIEITELSQSPGAPGSARQVVLCEGEHDITVVVKPSNGGRYRPGQARLVEASYGCRFDECIGWGGTYENARILMPAL